MDKKPVTSNQKPEECCKPVKIIILVSVLWFLVSVTAGAQDMETIKLPKPKLKSNVSLEEAIAKRRSVRSYSSEKLTIDQISQLLWACQGITGPRGLRAVPSAGALYPLEVYLLTDDGSYKYIPKGHKLEKINNKNIKGELKVAAWNQSFVEEASIDIIICAVYKRVTSRYGKRGIMYTDMEAGHAAENIHLEAVSLGLASVPVGAFNDGEVSKILALPGEEKPIYIIPVGYREDLR